MNSEILPEIRNKLTAPKVALERLARGEKVPGEFFELALEELKVAKVKGKRKVCVRAVDVFGFESVVVQEVG